LNDINFTTWPPRSSGRDGNDASMKYSSSSQYRDRYDQGPQNPAYYPPAAASGMRSTHDKPAYEGSYPPGHVYSCSCPECIAVTTVRLDRERAEREKKSEGTASRLENRRSYNDELSRYKDVARQPPQMNDQYGQQRSPLNEAHRPTISPLSPLIARPYPPQSNDRSVCPQNIDLEIANLIIDADASPPLMQGRPDPRRRQRLDNRRRNRELLERDFERLRWPWWYFLHVDCLLSFRVSAVIGGFVSLQDAVVFSEPNRCFWEIAFGIDWWIDMSYATDQTISC
jgi:hypothetical protein